MGISGIERVKLTGELKKIRSIITNPDTSGIERIKLTKEYRSVRSKIVGDKQSTKGLRLDKLVAGEYHNEKADAFISIVREIVEKEGAPLDAVKPPIVDYVEGHKQRQAA